MKKIILFKVNHINGQIKQVYSIRNTLHCWPLSQSYRIDGSLQKMKKKQLRSLFIILLFLESGILLTFLEMC